MWALGVGSLLCLQRGMNFSANNGADTWRWVEDGAVLNTVKRQEHPLQLLFRNRFFQAGLEHTVLVDAESFGIIAHVMFQPKLYFRTKSAPSYYYFSLPLSVTISSYKFSLYYCYQKWCGEKMIHWRTKCFLVLDRTKLLNLWWCNLLYNWITEHNKRKDVVIYLALSCQK